MASNSEIVQTQGAHIGNYMHHDAIVKKILAIVIRCQHGRAYEIKKSLKESMLWDFSCFARTTAASGLCSRNTMPDNPISVSQ